MRNVAMILGVVFLAAVTGCNSTRWNFVGSERSPAPRPGTNTAAPTTASLVEYLNNNAGRVQSIEVSELDVTARAGFQKIGLHGRMMTEKPRNFRMKAAVFGNDAVDLGSNNDEFWFWISKMEPHPYQFYCPYKEIGERPIPQMPMPFQPEWVMETLGLGPYGPADKYQLDTSDPQYLKLVERSRSPQGMPVQKVIVMRRYEVQPPQPQVVAYLLVDEGSGKEICSAHIMDTQLDKTTGAILPHKLELRWPAQKTTLTMRLDGLAVNVRLPQTVFVRERLNGVPSFNLALMQIDADPVQRVRGAMPFSTK